MKNRFIHVFLILSLALVYSAFFPSDILATAYDCSVNDVANKADTAVPFADVIVVKYREVNGVRQYRRWNATRARWEDPDWIDVPT